MNNLQAVRAWQSWAKENDSSAGDVFPFDGGGCPWFAPDQQANAAKHFLCFAQTGDGTLFALWSEAGEAFDEAPIVALGNEGELGFIAQKAKDAIALFAAAGDENLDSTLAYGDLGEADDDLSEFVADTLGAALPKSFAPDAAKTRGLVDFIQKLTGNKYRAYSRD